jgi:hypothetical protein
MADKITVSSCSEEVLRSGGISGYLLTYFSAFPRDPKAEEEEF